MNNLTVARLYMLFALMLLVLGWKICQTSAEMISQEQAKKAAQIENLASDN